MDPYARVSQVWNGGPNSLTDPEDMEVMTFSKQAITECGGPEREKINFTVEYNVEELESPGNISIALVFDKTTTIGQTDLKSVQGQGVASFRMAGLPKYDNLKKLGAHQLDIVLTLRKRWSFGSICRTVATRKIVLVE
jgi:hypothetical protein